MDDISLRLLFAYGRGAVIDNPDARVGADMLLLQDTAGIPAPRYGERHCTVRTAPPDLHPLSVGGQCVERPVSAGGPEDSAALAVPIPGLGEDCRDGDARESGQHVR